MIVFLFGDREAGEINGYPPVFPLTDPDALTFRILLRGHGSPVFVQSTSPITPIHLKVHHMACVTLNIEYMNIYI